MRKGKLWKQMAVLMISAALAIPAPSVSAAAQSAEEKGFNLEQQEAVKLFVAEGNRAADDEEFTIKDGVLTKYTGTASKVVIPDGVTEIGSEAFFNCSNMTSVTIPSSVTRIGDDAFSFCAGLTEVIIPSSVTIIGDQAFLSCGNLKNVTISSGVTSIEHGAFAQCSALTSINIPSSMTSIGELAFAECSGLKNVSISPGIKSIGGFAFVGCSSLTSISIPNSVTNIGMTAFSRCSSLKNVSIPNSVKSIDMYAFYACDSLKSVSIPSSVTSIGTCAFGYYFGENEQDIKFSDFSIRGYSGSAAEAYAKKYGFVFEEIGGAGGISTITCKKKTYDVAYDASSFKISASSKSKLTFTSSEPKIAAVNKTTGKVTIKGTGTAVITIKAGKDSVKVTVKVSPKKASVKSAKAQKGRKLAVKWAKDKMASGYQVQVSTDKKFKKNVKSKNVSKTSYTFTKLKTGNRYYVRIRSYKKSGKETLYGAWSKSKLSGNVKK